MWVWCNHFPIRDNSITFGHLVPKVRPNAYMLLAEMLRLCNLFYTNWLNMDSIWIRIRTYWSSKACKINLVRFQFFVTDSSAQILISHAYKKLKSSILIYLSTHLNINLKPDRLIKLLKLLDCLAQIEDYWTKEFRNYLDKYLHRKHLSSDDECFYKNIRDKLVG